MSELVVQRVPVSALHPAPHNPRTISKERFEQLKRSLEAEPEMLDARPIIALPSGEVIAGNMRLRVAQALGWETIPTVYADLDERRAREWMIRDNNEYGLWQEDQLAEMVYDLQQQGSDLELLGFEAKELDKLLASVGVGGAEEDEVPEPPVEPITKSGDLWLLGEHRLLCGDSTRREDVERLMGGERAEMVWTDPPYGMDLNTDFSSEHSSLRMLAEKGLKGGRKYEPVIGDDAPFNPAPLLEYFAAAKELFLWGADYYAERLPSRNDGSWFVWDKRLDETADRMYGSCFELCWSKTRHRREVARIKWAGVFGVEQEPDRARYHPTQKPVALAAWFLERFSTTGSLIADPYLGSGTTIIAAEQLGRRAFAMELEPRYVDVAVTRWQNLTGQQARREPQVSSKESPSNSRSNSPE